MAVETKRGDAALLRAVAILRDLPEHGLVRAQVRAVGEPLDETTRLVEFSDDDGRPYAIVPWARDALLVLRTTPLAA
jgi:Domain of unknown function (DUF4926)